MSQNKKRLILIGPIPPPLGGVSMHLLRLGQLLKDDFETDVIDESKNIKKNIFNLRQFRLIGYINKLRQADLVWIHSGINSLRFFHIIAGKLLNKKVTLTLHAYPEKKSTLLRIVDQLIFGLSDLIITVNADILERINLPAAKTIVKFAYLPPVLEEEAKLPPSITNWIHETKQSGRKIICANAWRLDRFNNQDLYGVDMCIEVAKRLKSKGIPVRFIFNIATIDKYGDDYKNYQDLITKENLQDSFSLINESLSFVRLMKESDLVLRPTNTDGDSLTIREAIFLKKPIISSDVIDRPQESILFKNRDTDDLENKILDALQNNHVPNKTSKTNGDNSYYSFYKDTFMKLFHS